MADDELKLAGIDLSIVDVPKYIHPSVYICYSKIKNAGLGIFAKKKIVKGTLLGEYMGEIIDNPTIDDDTEYIFGSYDFCIDARDLEKSNYTRFINCITSYEEENVISILNSTDYIYNKNLKNRIFLFAKKDILENEELLYDYGDKYRNSLGINLSEN
jgi:SET domain-containing protein